MTDDLRIKLAMTREEIGLAIDGLACIVRPHEDSPARPLLRRLQAAYKDFSMLAVEVSEGGLRLSRPHNDEGGKR